MATKDDEKNKPVLGPGAVGDPSKPELTHEDYAAKEAAKAARAAAKSDTKKEDGSDG